MQTWERVAIERSFDTWYKYSRSRFKRRKLLRRYLRNWNRSFQLRQRELQTIKELKRFLQFSRITRSLKVWTEGLSRSRQLYAYQLHCLQSYIQKSKALLIPFQDESDGLTLRRFWNGWRNKSRFLQHANNEKSKKGVDKNKRVQLWIESLDNSVEYYISIDSAKIDTMMKAISSYNFEKRRNELSLALPHIKTKSTTRDILINTQSKIGSLKKSSLSTDPLLCLPVGDIDNNQEMAGNQQERGDLETQNCNTNTEHHNSVINDIKNNIKNKKEKLDAMNKDLQKRKASMMKAKKNVKIQILSIERCKKEIDHHCCQCGGIHVFNNHEPMHRKDCNRLKDKIRSLFYLKQALVEANEKLFKCDLDLAETSTNIDKAKEEMTISLSKGLFEMDCLN